MRQSKFFMPTLKETPSDAEAISHQLMLRGGYMRQVTAGVYAYLPLANIVLTKIATIVREEMANIEVPEMLMPILLPASLWQESGRYDSYGPNLFKLKDRHDRDFILGPTHEETFTDIVAKEVRSYKRLPFALYQIQTKFRDENRPRFGLLRGREFMMKDAYSFAATKGQLNEQYDDMRQAYQNIFQRVGLRVMGIIADSGTMGGKDSLEFQAPAAVGEDTIVYTENGQYAANLEKASSIDDFHPEQETSLPIEKVATPGVKTIAELANFLQVPMTRIVKSVLYVADGEPVMVLIRGDKQVNEVKLNNILDADEVHLASTDEEQAITGVLPGGIGPVHQSFAKKIIADESIAQLTNFIVGANETGYQFKNVNFNRDLAITDFVDVRLVEAGEKSVIDGTELKFTTGIEVGHLFKLGTRYSQTMNAMYLDQNGKTQPVIMGSYGIGISRLVSAIVEQHNDGRGILWPNAVAPFNIHIIQMKMNDDDQTKLAQKLYERFSSKFDVLYDDRHERAGVKFADADLVGAPIRVIVGKKASGGIVEVKQAGEKDTQEVTTDKLDAYITSKIG